MVWDLPIYYPRQVPLNASGQTTRISVVVTSSEPVTVTARSYDGALTIADPQRSFGALTEPTTLSYDVAALAPGFHSLDIQMDGSSGPPYYSVGVSFGFVWTTGSPLPEPVHDARRTPLTAYGYQPSGGPPQLLTFVSNDYAYLGLPAIGYPKCAQEGQGCVRYWRNSGPTGLVQIGTGIVGTFHGKNLYTDGFVPPGPATSTPYGRYDFDRSLFFVGSGTSLSGTYAYLDRSRTTGLIREKVTLFKERGDRIGEYRLTYRFAGGSKRDFEGTFRIGRRGAITFFNDRGRVVQRGTALGTTGSRNRPLPLWLILSGRRGNRPDGNQLTRVP